MPLYNRDPKQELPETEAYTYDSARKEKGLGERLRSVLSVLIVCAVLIGLIALLYAVYGRLLQNA